LILEIKMTAEQVMAQGCLDIFDWYFVDFANSAPGCNEEHLKDILRQVSDGKITGTKANRFLGWAQAVLCMEGYLTLDEARNMNRQAIEESK